MPVRIVENTDASTVSDDDLAESHSQWKRMLRTRTWSWLIAGLLAYGILLILVSVTSNLTETSESLERVQGDLVEGVGWRLDLGIGSEIVLLTVTALLMVVATIAVAVVAASFGGGRGKDFDIDDVRGYLWRDWMQWIAYVAATGALALAVSRFREPGVLVVSFLVAGLALSIAIGISERQTQTISDRLELRNVGSRARKVKGALDGVLTRNSRADSARRLLRLRYWIGLILAFISVSVSAMVLTIWIARPIPDTDEFLELLGSVILLCLVGLQVQWSYRTLILDRLLWAVATFGGAALAVLAIVLGVIGTATIGEPRLLLMALTSTVLPLTLWGGLLWLGSRGHGPLGSMAFVACRNLKAELARLKNQEERLISRTG